MSLFVKEPRHDDNDLGVLTVAGIRPQPRGHERALVKTPFLSYGLAETAAFHSAHDGRRDVVCEHRTYYKMLVLINNYVLQTFV